MDRKRSYGQGQSETPQDRKERRGKTTAKNLAFAAVFAALCFAGTFAVTIPLPYGYFNAGDVFVLLSGWCLGPVYGSVAAAVGSSLADVLSGYVLYAPVTFVIKGVDALAAWAVHRAVRRLIAAERLDFVPRALSALVGEACMVAGYFLFESMLYGIAGGAASLIGNALQGVFGVVCAVILAETLYVVRPVRALFPALSPALPSKGAAAQR